LDDPRFASNERRVAHRGILAPLFEAALADVTVEEAQARRAAADRPYAQLNARARWRQADSPVGPLAALEPPFHLGGQPARMGPIPSAGQHTEDVLAELGYPPEARAALRASGAIG